MKKTTTQPIPGKLYRVSFLLGSYCTEAVLFSSLNTAIKGGPDITLSLHDVIMYLGVSEYRHNVLYKDRIGWVNIACVFRKT